MSGTILATKELLNKSLGTILQIVELNFSCMHLLCLYSAGECKWLFQNFPFLQPGWIPDPEGGLEMLGSLFDLIIITIIIIIIMNIKSTTSS